MIPRVGSSSASSCARAVTVQTHVLCSIMYSIHHAVEHFGNSFLSTTFVFFWLYFFLGWSSHQVEVFTGGTRGRSRRLLFNVRSMAWSHEVDGKSFPESHLLRMGIFFFFIYQIMIEPHKNYLCFWETPAHIWPHSGSYYRPIMSWKVMSFKSIECISFVQ